MSRSSERFTGVKRAVSVSITLADGGTVLGLFVCRNRGHEVAGRLHLESKLERGARFALDMTTRACLADTASKKDEEPEIITPPPSGILG